MFRILAYSDRLSVRQGERIQFHVSCDRAARYHAELVRVVCGHRSNLSPGLNLRRVESALDGEYVARNQEIDPGSYAEVQAPAIFSQLGSFSFVVWLQPWLLNAGFQTILSGGADPQSFALGIGNDGAIKLTCGGSVVLSLIESLVQKSWVLVGMVYDAGRNHVTVATSMSNGTRASQRLTAVGSALTRLSFSGAPMILAGQRAGQRVENHLNGRIGAPRLFAEVMPLADLFDCADLETALTRPQLVAAWDFSLRMDTNQIVDCSPNKLDGQLHQLPARGVTGASWTREFSSFHHAREQYDAVHFHADDLYDCGWEPSMEFIVPSTLASGIYALHLVDCDDPTEECFSTFFIRATTPSAPVAVLIPTATYICYGNNHADIDAIDTEVVGARAVVLTPTDLFLNEHRELGLSAYDTHADGSGVMYVSRLRPILNMQPGGKTQYFGFDTHITAWLEAIGQPFDLVTDEDLHREGLRALESYRVVITGTHPEYCSRDMLDAIAEFTDGLGRLMYLGGNGFYWRIAMNNTMPGVVEIRRGATGTRSWECEPGECHFSLTGEWAGLWREQGRPPQRLVGVGMTAMGFDRWAFYHRLPDSNDPSVDFIFEGISRDEEIGAPDLGAAGIEIDRWDPDLGSPAQALRLATSTNHSYATMLVVEDLMTTYSATNGRENALVRADMVYFVTPGGGAVFSTGSIAWALAMSNGGYENNVARITKNVLTRFLDVEPLPSTRRD